MTLSPTQIRTLHTLAARLAGKETGFLCIGDAQALTTLGLARRNRSGWEITLDGACLIEGQSPPPHPHACAPIPFRPRLH